MNRILATFVLGVFLTGLVPPSLVAQTPPAPGVTLPLPTERDPGTGTAVAPQGPPPRAETPPVLAKVETLVTAEEGGTLQLGAMEVVIPPGAVEADVVISLEELGQVATLNPGLENTTAGVAGYRLLPHRTFAQWVKLRVPYDREQVTTPAQREGLETYFFQEDSGVWTKVHKVAVDEVAGVVEGLTNHFTDFITGTLKLPDSPKPLGFNPTSIKDIKAADPGAGVPQVEGLEPGPTGAASFQIALRLPPGRAGMEPKLSLGYNSSGSSGWLGVGFDVSVPSVRIDTRFKLPEYLGKDLYSFGGQDLTLVSTNGNVSLFIPRVEGSFSQILRQPGVGHQYQWVVTEKSGRVSTYGGATGYNGGAPNRDYVWYLERTQDPNGNAVEYTYTKDQGHLYLASIEYTKKGSEAGAYKIVFVNEARPDRRTDVRGGFVDKMGLRLKTIQVWYQGGGTPRLVRAYQFEYTTTTFGKSILAAYREEDGAGAVFYRYAFDHQRVPVSADGRVLGFSDPKTWGQGRGDFSSGFSTSFNVGASLSGGLKAPVMFEVGANASGGGSWSYENSRMLDLNGDGIADILEHGMKDERVYTGEAPGFSTASETGLPWNLINQATSGQGNANVGLFASGLGASVSTSWSWDKSTSNWTYTDIDGDGLVDVVGPSDRYYKNTSTGGNVSFSSRSYGSASVGTVDKPLPAEVVKRFHLLDPLRLWEAWRPGVVDVTSQLSSTGAGAEGIRAWVYRSSGANQSVLDEATLSQGAADLGASSVTLGHRDHLTFRLKAGASVNDNTVAWAAQIRYRQVRLFDQLTSPRAGLLKPSYTKKTTRRSSNTTVTGSSPAEVLEPYYDYDTETDYDPEDGADSVQTETWTRTSVSEAALLLAASVGEYVPVLLSVADFRAYDKRTTSNADGQGSTEESFLGKYYRFDPSRNTMVLLSTSNDERVGILSHLTSLGWSPPSSTVALPLGLSGTVDGAGVVRSHQSLVRPITTTAPGVGRLNPSTGTVLVELSGVERWVRPYRDASGWHVETSQSDRPGTSTDRWTDGTPVSVANTDNLADTGTGTLKVTVQTPRGQVKAFTLGYALPQALDATTVWRVWGGQLVSTLTIAQRDAVRGALGMADRTRLDGLVDPVVTSYNLATGLANAQKASVLWTLIQAGAATLKASLTTAEYNAVAATLTGGDLTTWSGSFTLAGGTYTQKTLDEATQLFVLTQEVGAGVASVPATLTPTRYNAIVADLEPNQGAFVASWTPVVGSYQVKTGLVEADLAFVLWAQVLGGVTVDFGLKAVLATLGYQQNSGAASNPLFTNGVAQGSLYTLTNLEATLDFASTTDFDVTTLTVNGTVNEYGIGPRVANGDQDAVILARFSGDVLLEEPVYVHRFTFADDTQATDVFGGAADQTGLGGSLPVAEGDVVKAFGGGGRGWFYAEWDGTHDYQESKVRSYLDLLDQASEEDSDVSVETLRDAQVIWAMTWGGGTAFGEVWKGAATSRQEIVWDPVAKKSSTVQTLNFASLGPLTSRPYRVGGDEGIKTAASADLESGGGLAWVGGSEGESQSFSLGGGMVVGGYNTAYTVGTNWGRYDLMDLNGDALPDLVKSSGRVNLNTGAGFDPSSQDWGFSGLSTSSTTGLSLSASFSASSSISFEPVYNKSDEVVGTEVDPGSSSGTFSGSLGTNFSMGASYKSKGLMDVNGDGLPDDVRASGNSIVARLNTGSGFGPSFALPIPSSAKNILLADLRHQYGLLSIASDVLNQLSAKDPDSVLSYSGTTTASVSLSLSMTGMPNPLASVGGSAGGSLSGTTSRTFFDFTDLNGDGLADLVYKNLASGRIEVCFNLGDSYLEPVVWGSPSTMAPIDLQPRYYDPSSGSLKSANADGIVPNPALSPWVLHEEISSSSTISLSVNAGFSYTWYFPFVIPIPVPPFGIPFIPFVTAGANGSASFGTNSVEVSMADVNGDGLPDNVYDLAGTMVVRLNQSGQDGLVNRVITPQGGEIALEYTQTGNTPDDPNNHWVMSKVTRTNWARDRVAASDAAALPGHSLVNTFTYQSGYKDRADRSFWGFATVRSTRADGQTRITDYYNKGYYLKNQVKLVTTLAPDGTVLERQSTSYDTVLQVVAQGAQPSYWVKTTATLAETIADGRALTRQTVWDQYDAFGNPTRVEEWRNGERKHVIVLDYQTPNAYYQASLPTLLRVLDGTTGAVLRQRTGEYDSRGNLVRQDSYATSSQTLTTLLTWTTDGNLATETDNAGYTLSYTYDPVVRALVTRVEDNLGQSSGWTYDYALGVETSQTDTNGQVISKTYDTFGRMATVRSPYDTGTVPALAFEYRLTSYPWSAVTQNKVNYDPSDGQSIATVVLIDGQGRPLQTKKQTLVTDPNTQTATAGWSTSPWVVLDPQGREWQKGTPGFDPNPGRLGLDPTPVRTSFGSGDLYTQTTYDTRDRVIDLKLPDDSHQSTAYTLAVWKGEPAWRVTSTDPEGKKKQVWNDVDGQTLAVIQDPNGQAITSQFVYDGIGQMLQALDAGNHVTSIVYDQLGRRTSLDSPDAGLVTWEYDTNGDLARKVDPVLRAKNLSITYQYDKHRLVKTTYPDSVQTYTYGTDASQYNVGRLVAVAGDRVTTRTSYGKLGETTSVERTIQTRLPGNPDYVMTLGYQYNYLGQMTKVTYPDGEELSYSYDVGGQVTTITGEHLGTSFPYVSNIGYDHYGQRTTMTLGNGVTTTYHYDPARRWLTQSTTTGNTAVLQDLEYTFDRNGNVTTLVTSSAHTTNTQSYQYDELDQLVGAGGNYQDSTYTLAQKTTYGQSFTYDTLGNLTKKVSTLSRSPSTVVDGNLNYTLNYTYNPTKPHQPTHVGTEHYLYDANGNLTQTIPDWAWTGNTTNPRTITVTTQNNLDVGNQAIGEDRTTNTTTTTTGTRTMTWDWENRLRKVKDDQMEVTYDYDADGERRLKTLGTVETIYADRLYEVENGSARQLATVNVYLGDTRLVSKVVPLNSPSVGYEQQNTYYYHADHIGNSTLVTDYLGREYERFAFTPHGEIWQQSSLDTLDKVEYLFTGKQMDAETGWYNFGARYLNPKTGLWLSSDPALGEYIPKAPLTDEDKEANKNLPGMGGIYNPINFALYHFAGNNPVKYTDPDGREIGEITDNTHQQAGGDTKLGNSTDETIAGYGCVLTATVRIANSIGGTSVTLEQANDLAKSNNLYSGSKENELSIAAQAQLIGLITGKEISYKQFEGSETAMTSKLKELQSDDKTFYVSGRIHATNATATSKYDHQVNVLPLREYSGFSLGQGFRTIGGPVRINDTSTAGRTGTGGRVTGHPESLFRLNVFSVN